MTKITTAYSSGSIPGLHGSIELEIGGSERVIERFTDAYGDVSVQTGSFKNSVPEIKSFELGISRRDMDAILSDGKFADEQFPDEDVEDVKDALKEFHPVTLFFEDGRKGFLFFPENPEIIDIFVTKDGKNEWFGYCELKDM